MEKIDPEWVRNFMPRSGLSLAEFSIEPLDPDGQASCRKVNCAGLFDHRMNAVIIYHRSEIADSVSPVSPEDIANPL